MLNVPEVVNLLCKLSDKVMNNYLTADEFIGKAEDMLELKFPKAYKDRVTRELPENIDELESTGQASRVDEYVVSTIDTAILRHFDKKFPRIFWWLSVSPMLTALIWLSMKTVKSIVISTEQV